MTYENGGITVPDKLGPVIPNIPALNALCDKADVMMGKPKRGKDIKTFADLPADVQQTIDMMSTTDGKLDQAAKTRRTAIAIHYQTTCFGAQGM